MTASSPGRMWHVVEWRGSTADLHARPLVAGDRLVEVLEWRRPALVLGSTQSIADADIGAVDRVGADLVRRHSGGGAVLLRPGHDTWVDVTIPRVDPLWEDDVAVSFHWLGHVWVEALAAIGIRADVHLGASTSNAWSRQVCFAGLGAGEVTVTDADGQVRKVIGLSQRRTREGARFQCLALGSWDAAELLELLSFDAAGRGEAASALAGAAAGLDAPPRALADALIAALPD